MAFREGGIHLPGTASLVAQLDSTFVILLYQYRLSPRNSLSLHISFTRKYNDERRNSQSKC